jgi:hypothetical protein
MNRGSLYLPSLLSLLAVGCQAKGDPPPDAGSPDGSTHDAGDWSDAGTRDTGGPEDPWAFCPSGPPPASDPSWMHTITVAADAQFCSFNTILPLAQALARAKVVRLVAGTYAFPDQSGRARAHLPFCVRAQGGRSAASADGGELTTSRRPFLGQELLEHFLLQPLTLGGTPHVLFTQTSSYFPTGDPAPTIGIGGSTVDRVSEVFHQLCPGESCRGSSEILAPCPAPGDGVEATVSFDRGEMTVTTVLASGGFGPVSPAMLARASGSLDGVSFEQADYFRLAHRPDHHNWGGGYLVLFETPIGQACGIEAYVPSADGSFWVDEPAAWLVGCDLSRREALANVRPAP